jgi:type I restriction-modification system DNA methylase subunit
LDSEERFDWRIAAYVLNVPMIRALFEELARPSVAGALDLCGVLERTGEVLNRVEREAFFENLDEEGAVQYFYEPFLEAFDPELRKQFGVWYTPNEAVRYMVERVDFVLRSELGIGDGDGESLQGGS